MAFSREAARVPVAIAGISVQLYSPDPTGYEVAAASYSVQVRYNDGTISVLTGDLVPHLTPAQVNGLLAFLADMRAKAIAEILPVTAR